jgi:hypothetical protein
MPADVFSFYQRCNGLRLENKWQILGLQELQVIREIDVRTDITYEASDVIICGEPYLRFFERGDGAFAVIHLDPHGDRKGEIRSPQQNIYEVDSSNKCTLVAKSLSEFVTALVSQT